MKKRRRKRGRRSGSLLRIQRRVSKFPLPSVLLANVQSLKNKIDDLRLRLSPQRDIKNCNILCFTETWLNEDTDNIELAGLPLVRRGVLLNKSRGIALLKYLMISCRPQYLPREFSSVLFVAVYLPPQNEAGTKTAFNQL